MGDENKLLPRPIFRRNVSWDPFPNWTQASRIFAQDFGLPPLLEPSDVNWLAWANKRLASFSWPGFTRSPFLAPFNGQPTQAFSPLRQLPGGVSEVSIGQGILRINLDVNHFSPEEIAITTKEGYLEISGRHEEKQDEHGSVSRCFTRKYKLPQGVDLQRMVSSLSTDGVLSVEAPVPENITCATANEIVIPIQIRHEQESEK